MIAKKILNVAKVWNPNSMQDIGHYFQINGYSYNDTYFTIKNAGKHDKNQIFYSEIYDTDGDNWSCGYNIDPTRGFVVRSYRSRSSGNMKKALFAGLIIWNTTNSHYSPYKIFLYSNYNNEYHFGRRERLDYGLNDSCYFYTQVAIALNQDITRVFDRTIYWSSEYYYNIEFFPGADHTCGSGNSKYYDERNFDQSENKTYYLDRYVLNINNPFFPVFDNEEDMWAYLDDYESEEKASKALNYYSLNNSSFSNNENYKYKNLANIVKSYHNNLQETINVDYNSVDSNILTPLKNLINSYKNINYTNKINELKEQRDNLFKKYINLNSIELATSKKVAERITLPTSAPLTIYPSYSAFTTEELENIKTYVENIINESYGGNREYLLMVGARDTNYTQSYEDESMYNKIRILVFLSNDNGENLLWLDNGNYEAYKNGSHIYDININNDKDLKRILLSSPKIYFGKYWVDCYTYSGSGSSLNKELPSFRCNQNDCFNFLYDTVEKECSDYTGGIFPSLDYTYANLNDFNGYNTSKTTFDVYSERGSIVLKRFNSCVPFYSTADFYLRGETIYLTRNDYNGSWSRYYPTNGQLPDGCLSQTTKEIPAGICIYYDYGPGRNYNYAYMKFSTETCLMFRATPEQDPYANVEDIDAPGITVVKPIISLLNRYSMSHINGWDGNKLKLADRYLLAPQVGAGAKENDNSFTGIVMGVTQLNANSSDGQRIGLLGFHKGIQSIFLNSKDGSAIFGKPNAGQIVIDPRTDRGMLYSSTYWKDFNSEDGKPINYNNSNKNYQGMLIDFTTPEIRYGNGNFVVTKEGHMTAVGGGHIAGWKITDTTIESDIPINQGRLVIDSGATVTGQDANGNKTYNYDYGKIYSGNHNTVNNSNTGFYLGKDGFSICNGANNRIEIDTSNPNSAPTIYSGGHSSLDSTANGFYLGNDGLGIGQYFKIQTIGTFYLGYNATTFSCSNLDQPKTFTIGGSANSIYIGTEGFRLGNKTAVDNNGNLVTEHLIIKNTASNVATMCWIGNWQFTNENFGAVNKINDSQWNRLWMSTHGLIQAEQWNKEPFPGGQPVRDYTILWSLNTDGSATFTNLNATIPSGKNLTVAGGLTVSGNATVSGTLSVGSSVVLKGGTGQTSKIGGFDIGDDRIGSSTVGIYTDGSLYCKTFSASSSASVAGNISTTNSGNITAAGSIDAASLGSTLLAVLDARYVLKTEKEEVYYDIQGATNNKWFYCP